MKEDIVTKARASVHKAMAFQELAGVPLQLSNNTLWQLYFSSFLCPLGTFDPVFQEAWGESGGGSVGRCTADLRGRAPRITTSPRVSMSNGAQPSPGLTQAGSWAPF